MKALVKFFSFILAMVVAIQINNVYAEIKVIDNVPYIHQVEDTNETEFFGHNACGSTAATMAAQFNKVQPIPISSYGGWYVWNSYANFIDKSGQNYDGYDEDGGCIEEEWAMDMNKDENHEHSVCGAHGFIVFNDGTALDPYWGTRSAYLETYLKNHGLIVKKQEININGTANEIYNLIKQNIDAGMPLIGHWPGHYMVVIGYDTGENDDEQNLIIHDPYGDRNGTYDEIKGYWPCGPSAIYDYPEVKTGITFDKFWTVHPVGVYFYFPGYRDKNTLNCLEEEVTQPSQPFVDCYNENGGKDTFGIPWNNGQSVFVHHWPEGSSSENTIFLQDFICTNGHWHQLVLNQLMNKAFPVHNKILYFWHNNSGYSNYGEPTCNEYYATEVISGHKLAMQNFEKGGIVRYIGFDTEGGVGAVAREYFANEIKSPTRFMDFEDGIDNQPIQSSIPGIVFTTTNECDWVYGDWRAGYNGPYPNGAYYSNGNFFAWLKKSQGTGRIDFIGSTATYLSLLTSTYSGLRMDAYDINDNLLANSGWAGGNLWTGEMARLTVSAPNIAYVLIHDNFNCWIIDDIEVGDLLAETKMYLPVSFITKYEDIDTLNQDQGKWKTFFNKVFQTIKIILGWDGSELSIQVYDPNGILYNEYQSQEPPIIIDIPNAEPGQWQFKITAIDVPHDNYAFALIVGSSPNTPPTANAGENQTVEVNSNCMAIATLDGSESFDTDQDELTYAWTWDNNSATGINPEIQLPLGTHIIELTVNDGTADSEIDTVEITVIDATPPEITVIATPNILWPPNHKMVLITTEIITIDNCCSEIAIKLISITINEGEEINTYDPNYDANVADGDTSNDIEVDEDGNIRLRAERSGKEDGRIYTITYTATDNSGNSASASTVVTVPHDCGE